MRQDATGLEILSHEDCLALLASVPIGRVVFTDRALPAIQPVNFVLDGDVIVFRTGSGSKLAAATRQAVVAFQADSFDTASRTGWSVAVVGSSRRVTDPDEIAKLETLPIDPWVPTERSEYVKIELANVTGRRFPHAARNGG